MPSDMYHMARSEMAVLKKPHNDKNSLCKNKMYYVYHLDILMDAIDWFLLHNAQLNCDPFFNPFCKQK